MDSAVVACQVVLAAVFSIAAVGKLLDLQGSQRALTGFGLSERTASVAGTLLPLAELAIAVALVLHPTAQWAAAAALLLLLTFIGGISNAMARGETPDCNCFGALHSSQAGAGALARNAALALLAAFVTWRGPGQSISAWVADRDAAELVAIGTGVTALALMGVWLRTQRENKGLRSHLAAAHETVGKIPPGLPVGAMAPDFAVPAAGDDVLARDSLLAPGLPVALVFVRAGCGPSEALVPDFERWRNTMADRLTVGLVGAGSVARYHGAPEGPLADVVERDPDLKQELDELGEVFATYRLRATPSAVVLTPGGTIASATVDGRPAIEALLRLSLARGASKAVLTGT